MLNQLDLLREMPWNILVILDACRPDALAECLPDCEAVRSPAWVTFRWVHAFARAFGQEPLLYVTANPAVNRQLSHHAAATANWRLINVWQTSWGLLGPHRMPSVPPSAPYDKALEYVELHGQPARMVVHFLQPHAPYIGNPSLPYSGWAARGRDPLSAAVAAAGTPIRRAVAEGIVTREQIAAAYAGNVHAVVPWAECLIESVKGTVVLTADHAELLGEDGLYGHAHKHPLLHEVPWRVWENGPFTPAALVPMETDAAADARPKLKALGYV